MTLSKESWVEMLLILSNLTYLKFKWDALLRSKKKKQFNIVLLYYTVPVYLTTGFSNWTIE